MKWDELLEYYNKTEELQFIKEHGIEMSTVQEILDSDEVSFHHYKFSIKPLKELARHRKALERVDSLLEIYREGYDPTK